MGTEYLIGWRPFEPEFNGEKVSMEIRPFRRKAMLAVRPLLEKWEEMPKDQDTDALFDMTLEFQELGSQVLSEHIRNIDMKVRDSESEEARPVTAEDLTEEMQFLPLLLVVISKIASISGVNSGDVKNFGGPSGSMAEQAGTVA